jgi:hypothetical protein
LHTYQIRQHRIQYISLITYTNKALAQNEFEGLTFSCPSGRRCLTTGAVVLDYYKLQDMPKWQCVGINAVLFVGLLALGFFFYKRTSQPLMRLF